MEEGAPIQQVTMHLRRIDGQWKVDLMRAMHLQEPAARAETLKYMRLHAKAQQAVAAKFQEGAVKDPATAEYLVRMEMMRIEADESRERPSATRPASTRSAATSKPAARAPRATASDAPARGETLRIMTDGRVACLAYAPDAKRLVSGARMAEHPLRLWEASTGALVRDFQPPADLHVHINDVTWTPDGKHVITCGQTFRKVGVRELVDAGRGSEVERELEPVDYLLRLWDVETGRVVRELKGHTDAVFRIDLAPDGVTLASASADGTVRLWDVTTGQHKLTINAVANQGDFAYGIDFFPDGATLASFGSDNTVRVFETKGGTELRRRNIERGTFDVAVSPDGARVACSRLMAVQLFAADGTSQGAIAFMPDAGFLARINALAWTPDGSRLIAADGMEEDPTRSAPVGFAFEANQSIRVWDAATGRQLAKYRGHVNAVLDLAIAADGKSFASASADGSIRVWKMPD
jgi:WD40 repeat protein